MIKQIINIGRIVLIFVGTIVLICSCGSATSTSDVNLDSLKTQQTINMLLVSSKDAKINYRFRAPIMERYEYAKEPYTEYKKGLHITTYDDSGRVESDLKGDYAIFLENKKLWEVRGNVVAKNVKGEILETEQLFWDQVTKKIYSNVESRVIQKEDVIVGEGFESDERMENFLFRKPKGRIAVDAMTRPDATKSDSLSIDDKSKIIAGDSVLKSE